MKHLLTVGFRSFEDVGIITCFFFTGSTHLHNFSVSYSYNLVIRSSAASRPVVFLQLSIKITCVITVVASLSE